jgi:hypothetical protein
MPTTSGQTATSGHYASAVVFHNGVGDYVLALPTLRALAALLPRPSLLVAGRGPHEFLLADSGFDRQWLIPFARTESSTEFEWREVAEVSRGCEILVAVCPYRSESLDRLVAAVTPARTIGMGPPCTEVVDYLVDAHECDALFQAARAVQPTAEIAQFAWPPPSSPRGSETANRIRAAVPAPDRLLVVHVDSIREKTWPMASVDATLDRLLGRYDEVHVVVLNASPADLPTVVASGRVACLQGLGLDRAMSLVAACDVFLGIDSCMLHAADLSRRAGVGLFAATPSRRFGFRWSDRQLVRELEAARMSDFDPVTVADAIGSLLSAQRAQAQGRRLTPA